MYICIQYVTLYTYIKDNPTWSCLRYEVREVLLCLTGLEVLVPSLTLSSLATWNIETSTCDANSSSEYKCVELGDTVCYVILYHVVSYGPTRHHKI